jgi:transposase
METDNGYFCGNHHFHFIFGGQFSVNLLSRDRLRDYHSAFSSALQAVHSTHHHHRRG